MATVMKEEHQECIRLFCKVQGGLIQQIVQAVDEPYLAALRDRNSNSLRSTANQFLEHLQNLYGRVTPQILEDWETELKNMTYQP
jgi:hypothetical protein